MRLLNAPSSGCLLWALSSDSSEMVSAIMVEDIRRAIWRVTNFPNMQWPSTLIMTLTNSSATPLSKTSHLTAFLLSLMSLLDVDVCNFKRAFVSLDRHHLDVEQVILVTCYLWWQTLEHTYRLFQTHFADKGYALRRYLPCVSFIITLWTFMIKHDSFWQFTNKAKQSLNTSFLSLQVCSSIGDLRHDPVSLIKVAGVGNGEINIFYHLDVQSRETFHI